MVSDPNGYNDIEKVIINLDYLNENLSFVWRQAGEDFEEIGDIYGYGSIVSTPTDSYHDSNDQWKLDFKIIFDWDFPHENIFGVMVRSWDFSNTELTKYYINIARVENDLELIGKTSVSSDIHHWYLWLRCLGADGCWESPTHGTQSSTGVESSGEVCIIV